MRALALWPIYATAVAVGDKKNRVSYVEDAI